MNEVDPFSRMPSRSAAVLAAGLLACTGAVAAEAAPTPHLSPGDTVQLEPGLPGRITHDHLAVRADQALNYSHQHQDQLVVIRLDTFKDKRPPFSLKISAAGVIDNTSDKSLEFFNLPYKLAGHRRRLTVNTFQSEPHKNKHGISFSYKKIGYKAYMINPK
jgi:hypothetical protein